MRSSRMGQDYEPKGDGKSGIAGRVFIIIIVCVVIYFVSAGAVGKWIAQNIVTPCFLFLKKTMRRTRYPQADATQARRIL